MSRKHGKRDNRYLARLVTGDKAPCAFCRREVDDEITYGKLYAIGDIQCHYFCALLSCCLVQKGSDEDGLFGFLYKDILAELERSKKHKCSYCCRGGANLGCSISSCRKQFHLPCGRDRDAVSLYYGTYKTFCQLHAPKQHIPEHIMCKCRVRMRASKRGKSPIDLEISTELKNGDNADARDGVMVCVICYETVAGYPTVGTFWPPCCARDAWFHRTCLQRMALSAGMHYLKCPLCNDKNIFYEAVVSQGYYVPDRDAAWELEQNAFAEIYERPLTCAAELCRCPQGRGHDSDQGSWDIKLCLLCGSVGAHAQCIGAAATTWYICVTCTPAAPLDVQALADTIEELIQQEQSSTAVAVRRGPIMCSRMSLRRTKQRANNMPSSSRGHNVKRECESTGQSFDTRASRQELNLGTPRVPISEFNRTNSSKIHISSPVKIKEFGSHLQSQYVSYKNLESYKHIELYKHNEKLMSPTKILDCLREKVLSVGSNEAWDEQIVNILKEKLKKPRPLSVKVKIVENFFNGLFDSTDLGKQKEPLRETSPRKCYDQPEEHQTTSDNVKPCVDIFENTQDTIKLGSIAAPNIIVQIPDKISPICELKFQINHTNHPETTNNCKNTPIKEELSNVSESEIHNEAKTNDNTVNEENEQLDNPAEINEIMQDNNKEGYKDISSDTFQMAETLGDKRKTVEMYHDSSLEISENEHSVNIDVVKFEEFDVTDTTNEHDGQTQCDNDKKSAFKCNPLDKESERTNVDIDLESFKNEYLNEVDREKCLFKHETVINDNANYGIYSSVVDFALDATMNEGKKRKIHFDMDAAKRRKMSEDDLNGDKDALEICKNLDEIAASDTMKVSKRKKKYVKDRRRTHKVRKTRANDKEINHNIDKKANGEKYVKDSVIEAEVFSVTSELKDSNETVRSKTDETKVKAKKRELKRLKAKEVCHKKLDKRKVLKDKREKATHAQDRYGAQKRIKDMIRNEKRVTAKQDNITHSKRRELHPEKRSKNRKTDRDVEVTIDQEETHRADNKRKRKVKTKLSISNKERDISVKIQWKKKQLRLKISKKGKEVDSQLKQYVLQYHREVATKEVLIKPEKEVRTPKRKYVKHIKCSPDKFKQMSIENFFKPKTDDK